MKEDREDSETGSDEAYNQWADTIKEISLTTGDKIDKDLAKFLSEAYLSHSVGRFNYQLQILRRIEDRLFGESLRLFLWLTGYVLAVVMSWDIHHSPMLAILHGALSWLYVVFRIIFG